jgi:starch synthase (maltosyl-transferring)
MFPRSNWGESKSHSTFKTVEKRLDYIKNMGFNVLYFPPVHPIGKQFRKGKNNSVNADRGDVGSPWAIGGTQGGHKAVLSKLGSLDEFRHLVKTAKQKGVFIALDLAYQCSPDHPYVEEHSEWFKKRPDDTIQYAENPPKKYQDIYPFDFSTEHWKELWEELKSIVLFWINNGVTIFRVDNPHTKSLYFWEWLIIEIKKKYPETVFLAEAFTRPRMMYRLAKLGFSQSYTYFAWRNTKRELINYLNELNDSDKIDYYRPNFWPNTPDILNEFLQYRDSTAFKIRFILAALLSPNYGIYGPVFELCENIPIKEGSEEYMNSEKYEIRKWNVYDKKSISDFIGKVNEIRNNNRIYQSNINFEFLNIDNESLLAFARYSDDYSNIHIIIINLDANWKQSGWLEVPIDKFNIERKKPYQVYDKLNNNYYIWNGSKNYIELNPENKTSHVFEIRKLKRTEENFDYYV